MKKLIRKIFSPFIKIIGKISWDDGRYDLDVYDRLEIKNILDHNNCVILTMKKKHLSTYAARFGHFLLTGRWGYWSHAVVNVEDFNDRLRLIEANSDGVIYCEFLKVFFCDDAILFKIPEPSQDQLIELFEDIGKKYDFEMNYKDDSAVNCVELVSQVLPGDPFKGKEISPDMFCDLGLEVLWKKTNRSP